MTRRKLKIDVQIKSAKSITGIFFLVLICIASISYGFESCNCPKNIVDIEKDSRFTITDSNKYSCSVFEKYTLLCTYHKNGKLNIEFLYEEKEMGKEGFFKSFFESGNIESEIEVIRNTNTGFEKWYNEDGTIEYLRENNKK